MRLTSACLMGSTTNHFGRPCRIDRDRLRFPLPAKLPEYERRTIASGRKRPRPQNGIQAKPDANRRKSMCTSMNNENILTKMQLDVHRFGWHCLSVHPRAGEAGSQFTYTIGLSETFGHPEIMIFGLDSKVSHGILHDCVNMIRNGTVFLPNVAYPGVIGGDFKVLFKVVRKDCLPEYFGAAVRFYDDQDFHGAVMFWPDKHGCFPWEASGSTAQREALDIVE
jgi:hypothetical protein